MLSISQYVLETLTATVTSVTCYAVEVFFVENLVL